MSEPIHTKQPSAAPHCDAAEHRCIVAGFGGQGVLTLGKLLCSAALDEGRLVTYLPSYGSEVRGGTANCQVVVSPKAIYSPLVEKADSLVILNQLSWERFAGRLKTGGLAVVNTSAMEENPRTADARLLALPAGQMAAELGNMQVTNVVMLGAFLTACPLVKAQTVLAALESVLGKRKQHLLEINLQAFEAGARFASERA